MIWSVSTFCRHLNTVLQALQSTTETADFFKQHVWRAQLLMLRGSLNTFSFKKIREDTMPNLDLSLHAKGVHYDSKHSFSSFFSFHPADAQIATHLMPVLVGIAKPDPWIPFRSASLNSAEGFGETKCIK